VRRFVWVPFAVALTAFVLPFATVSCGPLVTEPTGAELVLRSPPETRSSTSERAEIGQLVLAYGGGLATAAFIAFAFALVAGVRGWAGWPAAGGMAGVVALLALRFRDSGLPAGAGADVTVDTRVGAFIAAVAGALGALIAAVVWLREERRDPVAPIIPGIGATLIVIGYLMPSDRSEHAPHAYADSLDLRHPWRAAFWLLPVAVGALLWARRRTLTRDLSTVALGVLGPTGVVVSYDVWRLWREEGTQPGLARYSLLAGIVLSALWAYAVKRGRAGWPAAVRARPAPAPAAPRHDRSAPGSGGSPPAAP
jgi:hypothetical protein